MERVYRQDRHLGSALVYTEIYQIFEAFDKNLTQINPIHLEFLYRFNLQNANRIHDEHFPIILDYLYSSCKDTFQDSTDKFITATKTAELALTVGLGWWIQQTEVNISQISHDFGFLRNPHTTRLWNIRQKIDNYIQTNSSSINPETQPLQLGEFTWHGYAELGYCTYRNTKWIAPYNWLLMLLDIISGRLNTLLYALLADSQRKYRHVSLYKSLCMLYSSGDKCLIKYRNKFYNIVKVMPSLAISTVIKTSDPLPYTDFYREIISGLIKQGIDVHDIFIRLLCGAGTTTEEHHALLEISGLWKMWGHPIVDMNAGVEKVLRISSEPSYHLFESGRYYSCVFRYHFCKQYFRVNHKWPAIKTNIKIPKIIQRNIDNNTWDELPISPWRYEQFEHVKFDKTLDFNYHLEASDLISDSAIIPDFDQWVYEYDRDTLRLRNGNVKFPKRKQGRVLLQFLQTEVLNLEEEVAKFCRNDYDEKERVCVIIPKERELKIEPRFFVKQTLFNRFMQTLAESNVKEQIFPYIRFQSMSLTELQLSHRLTTLTRFLMHPEAMRHVIIVLDFSSWNLHFHYANMVDLLRDLDDLFGLNGFYELMHLNTERNWIFVQDRFNPPIIITGTNIPHSCNRAWIGSSTWFEGMLQKCWTLFTFCVELAAARRVQASISILGQGDNQTILLNVPPLAVLARKGLTIHDYIDNFLSALEEETKNAGLPIKREETWVSFSLMEYSRKYYLRGAQVSCALKRVSRLSSEANQLIKSLPSDISGVYSSACTIAQEDHNCIAAYGLCVIEGCRILDRYFDDDMNIEERCIMLTNPRITGGLPVSLFSSFTIRGCPDPLSESLSFFRFCWVNHPNLREYIKKHLNLQWSYHRDFKFLIKDPVSLNIDLPLQIENYLRGILEEGLVNFTKNKMYVNLFSTDTAIEERNLINDLMNIHPANPRIMNYLWSLSNIGAKELIVGRFNRTRSIQQVVLSQLSKTELSCVLDNITYSQVQFYKQGCWSKRVEEILDSEEWCAMDVADKLRTASWGIQLTGVCMPSICEQWMLVKYSNIPYQWVERSILFDVQNIPACGYDMTRGNIAPYFGSRTREKIKKPTLMTSQVDSVISSLKRLIMIKPWVSSAKDDAEEERESRLGQLVDMMIREKTTESLDKLKWMSPEIYSGSIYHRLQDRATDHRSLTNGTYNFSTHVRFTSDYAVKFAKQTCNYTLFFQLAFLYGNSVLQMMNLLGFDISGTWALVNVCPSCTRLIPEEDYCIKSNITYKGVNIGNVISNIDTLNPMSNLPVKEKGAVRSMSTHFGRKISRILIHLIKYDVYQSQIEVSTYQDAISLGLNLTELAKCDLEIILNVCYMYVVTYSQSCFYSLISYLQLKIKRSKTDYNVIVKIMESLLLSGIVRKFLTKKNIEIPLIWLTDPSHYVQFFGYLLTTVSKKRPEQHVRWNLMVPEDGDELIMKRIDKMKILTECTSGSSLSRHILSMPCIVMNEFESAAAIRKFSPLEIEETLTATQISINTSHIETATIQNQHQYHRKISWKDNFNPSALIIGDPHSGVCLIALLRILNLKDINQISIINDFDYAWSLIVLHELSHLENLRTINGLDKGERYSGAKRPIAIELDKCEIKRETLIDFMLLDSGSVKLEDKIIHLKHHTFDSLDVLTILDATNIHEDILEMITHYLVLCKHRILIRCHTTQIEIISILIRNRIYTVHYSILECLNPFTIWIHFNPASDIQLLREENLELTVNYVTQSLSTKSRTGIILERYMYFYQNYLYAVDNPCIVALSRCSFSSIIKDCRNSEGILLSIEKEEDSLSDALEKFDIKVLKESFRRTSLYSSDLVCGRSDPIYGLMEQYIKIKFIKDMFHMCKGQDRLSLPLRLTDFKLVHVHFLPDKRISFCEEKRCPQAMYFKTKFSFSHYYQVEPTAWLSLASFFNHINRSETISRYQIMSIS